RKRSYPTYPRAPKGATKVTCPFTYASSVDTVLQCGANPGHAQGGTTSSAMATMPRSTQRRHATGDGATGAGGGCGASSGSGVAKVSTLARIGGRSGAGPSELARPSAIASLNAHCNPLGLRTRAFVVRLASCKLSRRMRTVGLTALVVALGVAVAAARQRVDYAFTVVAPRSVSRSQLV